jgi:hypothetical protein
VNIWSFNTKENLPRNPISPANFLDFQKMNTTLDGLEGYFTFVTPAQLQTDSGTEMTNALFVTANMFKHARPQRRARPGLFPRRRSAGYGV